MYGGEGQDDQEQLRALYEERRQIVDKYDLGREDGAVIDDWEDPKLEIYHKTDRFGFITDSRLPDTLYRKVLKRVLSRLHRCNGRNVFPDTHKCGLTFTSDRKAVKGLR